MYPWILLVQKIPRTPAGVAGSLAPVAREGIVVKPMEERRHGKIGRLMIKQRSPEYLAASDF